MKVLILGATGMLGYSLYSNLSANPKLSVFGSVRSISGKERFFNDLRNNLVYLDDITDLVSVEATITELVPDVVINCIGLIKQYDIAKQHIEAIQINSLLPHQLAKICTKIGAKLIHFSTDCVFTGSSGGYLEKDTPDSQDLYGQSKKMGEVDYGGHLTFRTSIIGHELTSSVSLIDWFLAQSDNVKGFDRAVFSGFPTCYIAKVLQEKILGSDLAGLYHLSAEPIDKNSLLNLVKGVYCKDIEITSDSSFVIDRSLNSEKLRKSINFAPLNWKGLVELMFKDYEKRYQNEEA
ncbi:SDR family oxidoreductase [Vibrio kyushuensis]|uniref:dTDP-4-dehydrorhamnose reductase family protein n=1 Tax=Vibrio kyushuensis TaxID=2910249 RepID=UPI003D13B819